MNDDHHDGALLEDIDDKLQRLAEGMSVLLDGNKEIRKVIAGLPEMKGD